MSRWDDISQVNGVVKPRTLRQTALRLADQCPHAAYLYWLHDGTPGTAPLFRGRVFHEVAERITRTLVSLGEKRIAPDDGKAILEEVLLEHPEWPVPVSEMDGLRIMVHNFATHFECPDKPLVEQLFHLAVRDSVVSGTVDLSWVEGDTLFIRDWKTGYDVPSHDEIANKDKVTGRPRGAKAFQLIIYTLLMADGKAIATPWQIPPGINKFDVAFAFPALVNNEGTGLVERGVVIERPELIEHRTWLASSLIHRVERGFATGEWPAVPGSLCEKRCPARSECPLPEQFRKGSVKVGQDPQEAAEEYLFLTADAEELRSSLKEVALAQGPIPVGSDMELSHKRKDSRRMTAEGKRLLEQGKPVPPDMYRVSESMEFKLRKRGEGV
jgi:hypothetical protein